MKEEKKRKEMIGGQESRESSGQSVSAGGAVAVKSTQSPGFFNIFTGTGSSTSSNERSTKKPKTTDA